MNKIYMQKTNGENNNLGGKIVTGVRNGLALAKSVKGIWDTGRALYTGAQFAAKVAPYFLAL